MAHPYDWPDWLKYRHSPLLHAFDYSRNGWGRSGFRWDYNRYQGLYVVLPKYQPLKAVQ